MCPLCVGGAAWLVTYCLSGAGAAASGAAIARKRKIAARKASALSQSKDKLKTNGEINEHQPWKRNAATA